MSVQLRWLRLCTAGGIVLSLASCKDYPAVNSISTSMKQAVGTWQVEADDWVATCKRRLNIDPFNNDPNDNCDSSIDSQKQVNAAIVILNNYFGALADIASDDKWTFDQGIGDLGTAAGKLVKDGDAGKVTAITQLAKYLADFIGAQAREKALNGLLDKIPQVEVLVGVLREAIDRDYYGKVGLEGTRLRHVYDHAGKEAGVLLPTPDAAHLMLPECQDALPTWQGSRTALDDRQVLFQEYYSNQCTPIVARRTAAKQVDASAASVIDSLEVLKRNRATLNDKDTLKLIYDQVKDLADKIKAAQDAFKPSASTTATTASAN